MKIRLAGEKDIESLVDLWIELMEFHASFGIQLLIDKEKRAAIEEFLLGTITGKLSRIYIMDSGEAIVAMLIARVETRKEMFIYKKSGYIAETLVTKSFRGMNIGDELATTAHAWFDAEGAAYSELQVSVENESAIKFWKSKGYEPQTIRMIRRRK